MVNIFRMINTWSTVGQHAELPVLDVVLLRDVPCGEVADPVHRHDADILNGPQQVLDGDTLIIEDDISVTHLEGYQVSPDPGAVGGLYLVIEMVEDDVIDVLVPRKDLGNLTDSSLPHLYSVVYVR